MKIPGGSASWVFGLGAVMCAASCSWMVDEGASHHNVLIVTIDCLRADHVGVLGTKALTPNIDALAGIGTLFENAITAVATTYPSHATMFTGLYPRYHGVIANNYVLNSERETLAETLNNSGYATGAFVSLGGMLYNGNLAEGFEVVSDEARMNDVTPVRRGNAVNRLAIQWLRSRDDERPFAVWIHYFEPHGPYELQQYSEEKLGDYDGPFREGASVDQLTAVSDLRRLLEEPRNARALETLYEGEVREADRLVGEIIGELDRRDLLSRTIVVLAGDHGQGLGDRGHIVGHGAMLWEVVMHVPLVVYAPNADGPARVATRVGLVDIAPTILDLVGIEPGAEMQGRSLRPAIEGKLMPEVPYFGEVRPINDDSARRAEALAVYLGRHKLVTLPQHQWLFDLTVDPLETTRLSQDDHATLVAIMSRLADEFLSNRYDATRADLSAEDLEDLRTLGYLR